MYVFECGEVDAHRSEDLHGILFKKGSSYFAFLRNEGSDQVYLERDDQGISCHDDIENISVI